jgi:hypothetical protein
MVRLVILIAGAVVFLSSSGIHLVRTTQNRATVSFKTIYSHPLCFITYAIIEVY